MADAIRGAQTCARQCSVCGNAFSYIVGSRGLKKFCSVGCRDNRQAEYNRARKLRTVVPCTDCGEPSLPAGQKGPTPTRCGSCAKAFRVGYHARYRSLHTQQKTALQCAVCRSDFESSYAKAKSCSKKCKAELLRRAFTKKRTLECEHCSKLFVPKRSGRCRFCSRSCGYAAQRAGKNNAKFNRAKAAARRKIWPKSRVWCAECPRCHQAYIARRKREHCSDECAYQAALEIKRQTRPKTPKRACASCGGPTRGTRCSTCNLRISRFEAKIRYRARCRRLQVEKVDPLIVCARDGWRCQSCNVKTPKHLRGTFGPTAPECDHIVPVSKGGSHTYQNLQCLCRACNAAKGNRLVGQLRLFG